MSQAALLAVLAIALGVLASEMLDRTVTLPRLL